MLGFVTLGVSIASLVVVIVMARQTGEYRRRAEAAAERARQVMELYR